MFETNTASCAGFPGVSDSFGASLWSVGKHHVVALDQLSYSTNASSGMVDWTLQLAFKNFSSTFYGYESCMLVHSMRSRSAVLFHFGGQDASYNGA